MSPSTTVGPELPDLVDRTWVAMREAETHLREDPFTLRTLQAHREIFDRHVRSFHFDQIWMCRKCGNLGAPCADVRAVAGVYLPGIVAATPAPPDLLAAARRVAVQLDVRQPAHVLSLPPAVRMAIQGLKVQEEAGELATAINGVLGENPRKGVHKAVDDVLHEALDVVLAALVLGVRAAPERFEQMIGERLGFLADRAAASGAPEVTS